MSQNEINCFLQFESGALDVNGYQECMRNVQYAPVAGQGETPPAPIATDINAWNAELNTALGNAQLVGQPISTQEIAPPIPYPNAMYMPQQEELPVPTESPEFFQPDYAPRIPEVQATSIPFYDPRPAARIANARAEYDSILNDTAMYDEQATVNQGIPPAVVPRQFPTTFDQDVDYNEQFEAPRNPYEGMEWNRETGRYERPIPEVPKSPEQIRAERQNFLDNLSMAAYFMTPVYSKDRSAHMRGGLEMMQKRREARAKSKMGAKAPTTKWRPVPGKSGWEQEYSWDGASWNVIPGTQRPRHKPREVSKQIITYTKPDGTPGRAWVNETTDMSQYPNWQAEKLVTYQPTTTQSGATYKYDPTTGDMTQVSELDPTGGAGKILTKEQQKSLKKLVKADPFFEGKKFNSGLFNQRVSDYMAKGLGFDNAKEKAKQDLYLVEENTFSADDYSLNPMQEVTPKPKATPTQGPPGAVACEAPSGWCTPDGKPYILK